MLVLTRKNGEAISIGDEIEIKIVQVSGDQVKIGINAPSSIKVYRKEIYDAIQEENKKAGQIKLNDLQNIIIAKG